jgi:hypothetical protein
MFGLLNSLLNQQRSPQTAIKIDHRSIFIDPPTKTCKFTVKQNWLLLFQQYSNDGFYVYDGYEKSYLLWNQEKRMSNDEMRYGHLEKHTLQWSCVGALDDSKASIICP